LLRSKSDSRRDFPGARFVDVDFRRIFLLAEVPEHVSRDRIVLLSSPAAALLGHSRHGFLPVRFRSSLAHEKTRLMALLADSGYVLFRRAIGKFLRQNP